MAFDFRECYHPELSNTDQVREIMATYANENGNYLVRNSTSRPGGFTVSVIHDFSIKHISVSQTKSGYSLQEGEFPSMNKLIEYYSETDVPNAENIRDIRFRYPIINPFPEDEAQNQLVRLRDKAKLPTRQVPEVPGSRRRSTGSVVLNTERPLRPALPLPKEVSSDSSLVYSSIDEVTDLVPSLLQQLNENDEKCECGLYPEEAELPYGWTMHLSTEPHMNGRLFFMGPEGQTKWKLPIDMSDLSPDQQERIKRFQSDYESKKRGGAQDGAVYASRRYFRHSVGGTADHAQAASSKSHEMLMATPSRHAPNTTAIAHTYLRQGHVSANNVTVTDTHLRQRPVSANVADEDEIFITKI